MSTSIPTTSGPKSASGQSFRFTRPPMTSGLPHQRTSWPAGWCGSCQKRTHSLQLTAALFDHLVDAAGGDVMPSTLAVLRLTISSTFGTAGPSISSPFALQNSASVKTGDAECVNDASDSLADAGSQTKNQTNNAQYRSDLVLFPITQALALRFVRKPYLNTGCPSECGAASGATDC
jgi:hypothetical protein